MLPEYVVACERLPQGNHLIEYSRSATANPGAYTHRTSQHPFESRAKPELCVNRLIRNMKLRRSILRNSKVGNYYHLSICNITSQHLLFVQSFTLCLCHYLTAKHPFELVHQREHIGLTLFLTQHNYKDLSSPLYPACHVERRITHMTKIMPTGNSPYMSFKEVTITGLQMWIHLR